MKYLAITLGPIYETCRSVRHTREVWAASYLFSYIAKRIIEKLCENGGTAADAHYFVQPNISDARLFDKNQKIGVGLFPDRIIVNADILKERDFDVDIKGEIIEELATLMGDTQGFLGKYFRIDSCLCQVEESKNPIKVAAEYLETAELQPRLVSSFDLIPEGKKGSKLQANVLKLFMKAVNKNGFLKEHYQAKDINNTERFESLVEISTRELWKKDALAKSKYIQLVNRYLWKNGEDVDLDGDFVKALQKDFKDDFKTYHKYVCVVKADGDGIGKLITGFTGSDKIEQIEKLSKGLLEWGLEVKDVIRDYGGVPIYVGGDDLLFFAPVCNCYSKTAAQNIFSLLKQIKKSFEDKFETKKTTNDGDKVSLSFGLSITYYKFPLSEAMDKAGELLGLTKDETNQSNGKKGGKLAISLLKHSGSTFDFELKLQDEDALQVAFGKLYNTMTSDQSFLNGVNYKLRENQELIEKIANAESRLHNVFVNIFEEETELSKRKSQDEYLTVLRELLSLSFNKEFYRNKDTRQNRVKEGTTLAMREVFSAVRFAKFLRGYEELKD
ncbi:type III-B CRISPR-associated protein Cas10/Cmr2 [Runella zeae]|uniref:type III-B CRISPR-associated protein Cas10/Cmr2 n=1 Tax=Runella zeae TaxID=94255 RepID=UPI00042720A1|nr:type III-B CRISPR-associated protein Cas10/Cmr2 [Runella zeae]